MTDKIDNCKISLNNESAQDLIGQITKIINNDTNNFPQNKRLDSNEFYLFEKEIKCNIINNGEYIDCKLLGMNNTGEYGIARTKSNKVIFTKLKKNIEINNDNGDKINSESSIKTMTLPTESEEMIGGGKKFMKAGRGDNIGIALNENNKSDSISSSSINVNDCE